MGALKQDYVSVLASTIVLTVCFYPFERISPAESRQRIVDRAANYLYLPVILVWVLSLPLILTPWNAYLIRLAGGGVLFKIIRQQGVVAEIAVAFTFAIAWDTWQYWIHRWQHVWPLLWETHKFHHSETNLNTSSQARHHFLSYAVYIIAYAPMLLLFGIVTPHVVMSLLMFRVWGFVNHANIRVNLGWLTGIIAGPQWHRIHHSVEPRHMDKNFATFFPFIDRVFGTYYKPAHDEYPATGLAERSSASDLELATVDPLRAWYSMCKRLLRKSHRTTSAGAMPFSKGRECPSPGLRPPSPRSAGRGATRTSIEICCPSPRLRGEGARRADEGPQFT
jgi:sterol desaturase/sphingolipid hydroxylase (fatty acid hydroxylase superfamily)